MGPSSYPATEMRNLVLAVVDSRGQSLGPAEQHSWKYECCRPDNVGHFACGHIFSSDAFVFDKR